MSDSNSIKHEATIQAENAIDGKGTLYGVVQVGRTKCIAIFSQSYKGKLQGVVRQLLYGDDDSEPTFTKKGLNASSEEWGRIVNALVAAESLNLHDKDYIELLRLPIEGTSNAIQVYSHIFRDEVRIVIGKVFNYKNYAGKGSGASFSIEELSHVLIHLEAMLKDINDADKKLDALAETISTKSAANKIDYDRLYEDLFD